MSRALAGVPRRLLAAGVVLSLSACGDLPLEQSPPVGEVSAEHRELARMVAHSLREPAARAELMQSLRSSPVAEDKVHLAAHLAGGGAGPMLARMAASPQASAGGIGSRQAVLERVRSLGPMEMYFPVPGHQERWNGGEDLIVVVGLEEGTAPYGVTLDGRTVRLSPDHAPTVPALVITPSESFDAAEQPLASATKAPEPGPGDGPTVALAETRTQQRGAGRYEFYEYVRTTQTLEAWWKGMPEFQIFLMGTNDTDSYPELNTKYEIPNWVWGSIYSANTWVRMPDRIQMIYWMDFGTRIRARCWERDTGNTYQLSAGGSTIIKAVDVNFSGSVTITDGDDDCGYNYIVARTTSGSWTQIPTRSSSVLNQAGAVQWAGYGIIP